MITSKTFTELTTYGMNTQVGKRGNPHKWLIDFTTRLLNHKDARELTAFLDSLDGQYNTFTLPCSLPFLGSSTSFNVAANAVAGSNTVDVKNLQLNDVEALVVGDYINFDNHSKVYKIMQTVTSNGSGLATMTIYPRLQQNINVDDSIDEANFTVRMTKDTSSLSLVGGKLHLPIKFSVIEE